MNLIGTERESIGGLSVARIGMWGWIEHAPLSREKGTLDDLTAFAGQVFQTLD
jgi:hypothetical protein